MTLPDGLTGALNKTPDFPNRPRITANRFSHKHFDRCAIGVGVIWCAIWGLPADLVRELGLREGDQIDLLKDDGMLKVRRHPSAQEILEGLRRFMGRLPAAERLSRDAAHER